MDHVELERKFDVTVDTMRPCFDGLSGVSQTRQLPTQTLEAVYYDTANLDLSARRVALRRRTGGTDEGWHLKLPPTGPGLEARVEIQAPLGAEVPEELRDTVLAIVRDRPLYPVARIHNNRDVTVLHDDGGAPLAEFCDDHVTACRLNPGDGRVEDEQHWREWELEMTDATAPRAKELLDRLTARVFDAGAYPAAHGSKLAKILGGEDAGAEAADPVHRAVTEQVERLLECDRAVRVNAYDAVHQMRVATRQIRSLLQASETAFGLTDDAWILSELRELAAVLGVARDAEVLAERYQRALDKLAPELIRGPVRERLVGGAQRRYELGLRRSLMAMRSGRYFRMLDALENLTVSPPVATDTGEPTTIASSYRKVRKTAKSAQLATPAERDQALHRIRKAAKRLRYVAAATGATRVEKQSKVIQTLLGDHQDSVVSREHLIEQAAAAHAAGEDTFTYGVLHRMETESATRSEGHIDEALKALRQAI